MFNPVLKLNDFKLNIDWPLSRFRPALNTVGLEAGLVSDPLPPATKPQAVMSRAERGAGGSASGSPQRPGELEAFARQLEGEIQLLNDYLLQATDAPEVDLYLKRAVEQAHRILQALLTPAYHHALRVLTHFAFEDANLFNLVTSNIDLYLIDHNPEMPDSVLRLMRSSTTEPSVKATLATVRQVARMVRNGRVPRGDLEVWVRSLAAVVADFLPWLDEPQPSGDRAAVLGSLREISRAFAGLALTAYGAGVATAWTIPVDRAMAIEAIGRGLIAAATANLGLWADHS